MTTTPVEARFRSTPSVRVLTFVALLVLVDMLASSPALRAQQAPIGLGTADSFAVLAGTTITNTGPTTITGDVGLHPGNSVTGFDDVTLSGELHLADADAEQAKVDLVTTYNDAAGRGPVTTVATELGGQTLTGGVYDSASGTFGITGALTLDAEDDPDRVWVFQAASTLITASNSSVNLVNGADACNVYWQVGSSATLGTGSEFIGSILALESISLTTEATVEGRVLARNGAVTLDTNTITNGGCATATPTPTATPTASATASPSVTPTASATASPSVTPTAPPSVTPTPTAMPTTPTPTPRATPTTASPAGTGRPPTRIDTGAGGAVRSAARPTCCW